MGKVRVRETDPARSQCQLLSDWGHSAGQESEREGGEGRGIETALAQQTMLVSSCLAGSDCAFCWDCLSASPPLALSLSLFLSLYPTVSLVPLSVCASPATCNFVCPFCFIFVLSPSLRRAITVDATKAAATGDPQQQAAVLAACRLPLTRRLCATTCPAWWMDYAHPSPDPCSSSPAAFGILHDKRRGKWMLQGREAGEGCKVAAATVVWPFGCANNADAAAC